MEPMLVLMGLFLFGAILSNKELTKNVDNRDVLNFLTISGLFLLLPGLAFLFPSSQATFPNFSFIIPVYVFLAATIAFAGGKAKSIAIVATVSTFVFLIMGSYM